MPACAGMTDKGGAHCRESTVVVAIDDIEVLAGGLDRKEQRLVEAWAELHRAELLADWKLLQGGQSPRPIAPLLQEPHADPHPAHHASRRRGATHRARHVRGRATRSIDLTPILRGPVFGVLRNPAEFARVAIDPDFGALVWPSGADLDPGVLHAWPEEGERMAELAAGWE